MTSSTRLMLSALLFALPVTASAQSALDDQQCARRIANALSLSWRNAYTGLQGARVQSSVRPWLKSTAAIETFANYINMRFNTGPAANLGDVTPYYATKYILRNELPWRELFTGRYRIDLTNGQVKADPAAPALGYFSSFGWQNRYRGNEGAGYLLTASYRTLQNTVGLKLVPAPNNASGDATATGRERGECRGCHYDSPYALDKIARLLPRRKTDNPPSFEVVAPSPQVLFNGIEVNTHEELIATLVSSQAFSFWSCRLAFEFVYGRRESACEAHVFDACVSAFERSGSMEDALTSLLEDPDYCRAQP